MEIKDIQFLLEKQYEIVVNADNAGFYLGIADYLKFLDDCPNLNGIFNKIKKESIEDHKRIKELEKIAENEVIKKMDPIIKYLKKKKDSDKILSNRLRYFLGHIERKIESSESRAEGLYNSSVLIINELYDAGERELIDSLIEEEKEENTGVKNFIASYNLSDSFLLYKDEKETLKHKQKISIWGVWDRLVPIYQFTLGYTDLFDKVTIEDNGIMGFYGFFDLKRKLWDIIEGNKKDSEWMYKKDQLRADFSRLHIYILKRIKDFKIQKSRDSEQGKRKSIFKKKLALDNSFQEEMLEKSGIKFNVGLSEITYQGKTINIAREDMPFKLLKLLMISDKVVEYKIISEALNLELITKDRDNVSYARRVGDVKKDLKKFLVENLKMTKEEYERIFITVRRCGLKMLEINK